MEELRRRNACEWELRQALEDTEVVRLNQVAKAYQDGLEQHRSGVEGRSTLLYSMPSEEGDTLERNPIFTPAGGGAADNGGSQSLSSSIWPIAPTMVSTAVSFIAPLRAVVGSVFAS